MRRYLLLITFFTLTPLTILVSLLYLTFLETKSHQVLAATTVNTVAFAALPSTQNSVAAQVDQSDARIVSLTNFFARYNSPLTPYANRFVEDADQYGLDYRLIPAIAFQESLLCNKALSASPYNCYGWGITKNHIMTFSSYTEGIDTITRALAGWGLTTPAEIGKRYNPTNTNNWVANVTTVMNRL